LIYTIYGIIVFFFEVASDLRKSGNPTTRFLGYFLPIMGIIGIIAGVIFLLTFIENLFSPY